MVAQGTLPGVAAEAWSRYRTVETLGAGGQGSVVLAFDAVRGQEVALKRLRVVDPAAILRFKREFRVIAELLHPSLVQLYELAEDDKGLYFTMEVVRGTDLLAFTKRTAPGVVSEVAELAALPTVLPSDRDTLDGPPLDVLETQQAVGLGATRPPSDGPLAAPPIPMGNEPTNPIVRVPLRADLERLAHVLPQLLEALAFLHAHGVVHRDLKPQNVLVRPDGTLKLMDFGVLGVLGGESLAFGGEKEVVGTVGFMAPEQLNGGAAEPANDLYALGAMLFQIAAGRPVFTGPTPIVAYKHARQEAPRLADLVLDIPRALDQACAALLSKDPSARPSIADLSRTLLPALGARRPILAPPRVERPELVGRDHALADLRRRLRGSDAPFQLVLLEGPSGAGKTALAEAWADQAERSGLRVLRSRGRASEHLAFGAIDGAIDALALEVGRRFDSASVSGPIEVAATAFPVLGLIKPARTDPGRELPRGEVFNALVALLSELSSASSGVMVLLDDLQWADRDALSFLAHLVEAAPRGVIVAATLRTDVTDTPALAWSRAVAGATRVPVEPLAHEPLRAIAERAVLEAGGPVPSEEIMSELVTACAGRPFLAEVAARALAQGADRVRGTSHVAALIDELPPRDRKIIALLAAADGWLDARALASLLETTPGEIDDTLVHLERFGLIRRAGIAGPVDLYHDTVRASALETLGAGELSAAHGALAEVEGLPPARLVRHLAGAGRRAQAALRAMDAAREAEKGYAYALAAEMYEVALSHGESRNLAALSGRALALDRSGRYAEAADAFAAAAALAAGEELVDVRLKQAHAELAAGRVRDGRATLESVLSQSGSKLVRTIGGMWSGVRFMSGPARPSRRVPGVSEQVKKQAERDLCVSLLVGYFDPLAGIHFLHEAQQRFDQAGSVEHAAWIDYAFAQFAMLGSPKGGPVPLADRYVASARARLAEVPVQSPEGLPVPELVHAAAAEREGRWDDARAHLEQAVSLFEKCGLGGSFSHLQAIATRVQVETYAQDLAAMRAQLARLVQAAGSARLSAVGINVDFSESALALYEGRFGDARRIMAALRERWPDDVPTFQRFFVALTHAAPGVYDGSAVEDRRALLAALDRDARFRPMHSMFAGHIASVAALLEAAAMRSGDREASYKAVEKHAAIAREAPPFLTAGALRALAYAEDARGKPEKALAFLAEAEATAGTHGQKIDAAIARFQRGLRLGGDEGAAMRASAEAALDAMAASRALLREDAGLR